MGFDPYNCAMKIWKSIWKLDSQHGSSFGGVRVHSLTLFALPGACEVTPGSPSWPATLQPLTLVASPKLGLRHAMSFAKVWSRTHPPLGRCNLFISCFGSSSIRPKTYVVIMNRYGVSGQPCLTDLESLKSSSGSPFTLTNEDTSQ
jgi:hypothetical protein